MQDTIRSSAAHFAALADPCSLSLAVRAMRERLATRSLAKTAPEPQPTRQPFQLNRRASDAKPDERTEQRGRRIAKALNRRNRVFADLASGTLVWFPDEVDGPCLVVDNDHLRELVYRFVGEEIDEATTRQVAATLRSAYRL